MPRATLPPTPASSTDIQGQDGSKQLASLQTSFELPPPALNAGSATETAISKVQPAASTDVNMMSPPIHPETTPTAPSPPATYPVQAAETVKSRRRSSAIQAQAHAKDAFALPPPPTRSRKIIQMKPRVVPNSSTAGAVMDAPVLAPATAAGSASGGGKGASGKGGAGAASAAAKAYASAAPATTSATATVSAATGGKKKQPSSTSAAGRKIARKTAHSLIERRRRSKMNEEFAVLKSMIPACTGEMHKLAILQASIEYVRYLEDCVATLKAQCEREGHVPASSIDESRQPTPSGGGGEQYNPEHRFRPSYADDQISPDVEMAGTGDAADDMEEDDENDDDDDELPSPTSYPAARHPHSASVSSQSAIHQPSVSPPLLAQDASIQRQERHDSQSSTASLAGPMPGTADHHRHYSYSTSAQTSPAFGPQVSSTTFHHYGSISTTASNPGSTLTSPALAPQRDLDQEATAALLMLNSDRRGAGGNTASGRGMSVRDLLST